MWYLICSYVWGGGVEIKQPSTHSQHTPRSKEIKGIKTKLKDNEAMIAHTDKGNSLMILPVKQYDYKIADFIRAYNFQTTETDPTKTFQSQVTKVVTDSKTLIPQEIKWKYVNMNPTAPTIKGLIKMHKPEHPIRPVVNWRGAPAYKLARLFTQKIKQLAPLPNRHNVDNTRDVIKNLNDTSTLPHYTLASLDITNLYTNFPVAETRNIISNTLKENLIDPQTQQELLNFYDVIIQQNYFTINDEILIQRNGLAMGTPTSGLISEFLLQNLEHLHLAHISNKHKIINYLRYVDDILLIFDSNHTNIQNILDDFNTIHPNLKFTAETETNNKINYLDVTIHKTP